MTVHQSAESGADCLAPGILRILNNSGETVHGTTQIGHLTVPRMVYFQTGSDVLFRHIKAVLAASTHDPVLSRADELQRHLVSCRIFGTYVPIFRALDQLKYPPEMVSVAGNLSFKASRCQLIFPIGNVLTPIKRIYTCHV